MPRRLLASITIALVCVTGCGGTSSTDPPTTRSPATAEAPDQPPTSPPGEIEEAQLLDETAARQEASRLARAAFASRTDIVDAAGHRVPLAPEDFAPAAFRGGLIDDRWELAVEPAAGSYARVSFDRFGKDAQVQVGFSLD